MSNPVSVVLIDRASESDNAEIVSALHLASDEIKRLEKEIERLEERRNLLEDKLFNANLRLASEIVQTWPAWKQNVLTNPNS